MPIDAHDRESLPVVLVIDDQEANLRLVGQVLAPAGYDIAAALDGTEGLALATDARPDLILLDMRMHGMDGFEVLARLNASAQTRTIPVIFLTADNDRENLTRAFSDGAVDYIVKPFVAEELIARVRAHVDLKRARDRLARVAAERQRANEIVSHDLRNHFGNILFAAHMLRDDGAEAEQRHRLAQSIVASAEAGTLFLQTILDRDSAGGEPTNVRAHALFEQVAASLRLHADAKGATLRIGDTSEDVALRCDVAGAIHVLQNLVSNAIKYAPPGSETMFAARSHTDRVRLSVYDRGPGVGRQDRERLFQRFVRLGAVPTAGESTTGLGLALAKQRARAMGGDLWYDDREGGGAIFTLDLPIRPD